MKKIAKYIILSILLFIPFNVSATVIELTVTITSFTVPARDYFNLRAHTSFGQYSIGSSRIIVTNKNNKYVSKGRLISGSYDSIQMDTYLRKDSFSVLSFTYNPSLAPYETYAEIKLSDQGDRVICTAGCVPVAPNSGWLYTSNALDHFDDGANANCNGTCIYPNKSESDLYIAINPNNGSAVPEYNDDSNHDLENYYWRSESLYTVN